MVPRQRNRMRRVVRHRRDRLDRLGAAEQPHRPLARRIVRPIPRGSDRVARTGGVATSGAHAAHGAARGYGSPAGAARHSRSSPSRLASSSTVAASAVSCGAARSPSRPCGGGERRGCRGGEGDHVDAEAGIDRLQLRAPAAWRHRRGRAPAARCRRRSRGRSSSTRKKVAAKRWPPRPSRLQPRAQAARPGWSSARRRSSGVPIGSAKARRSSQGGGGCGHAIASAARPYAWSSRSSVVAP